MAKKFTVYSKSTCITCKKALAYLEKSKTDFDTVDIVKNPPPKKLLEAAIDGNNVKASLNSRSAIYKEKNLGAKTPDKRTAIELMLKDGNLIKRPFIVDAKGNAYLGFDEASLKKFLKG